MLASFSPAPSKAVVVVFADARVFTSVATRAVVRRLVDVKKITVVDLSIAEAEEALTLMSLTLPDVAVVAVLVLKARRGVADEDDTLS